MSFLCTDFTVRAEAARAEAARRHGTYITCRAVSMKKAVRENPRANEDQKRTESFHAKASE